MLSRKTTVSNAVGIILLAVPIVWAVGYQDHPWRNSLLAVVAAAVLIAAAAALHMAGRREDPPVSQGLTTAALVMATGSLGCALLWRWFA